MSLGTTRRRFVAGSVLLPIASHSSPESGAHEISNELARLQLRRAALIAERERLDQIWHTAYRALPRWCRPGPKYLTASGDPEGSIVGWPDVGENSIQLASEKRLVRPSPHDLRVLFEAEMLNTSHAPAARNYRDRSDQLRSRLRLRRKHYRLVSLPRTLDWLPLDVELEAVESAISSLLTGEQLVPHSGQRSSQVADHSSTDRVPQGHS